MRKVFTIFKSLASLVCRLALGFVGSCPATPADDAAGRR